MELFSEGDVADDSRELSGRIRMATMMPSSPAAARGSEVEEVALIAPLPAPASVESTVDIF